MSFPAPKFTKIKQEDEFTFRVTDSDGETVGVYGSHEQAEAVSKRRDIWHRDQFVRASGWPSWRKPE